MLYHANILHRGASKLYSETEYIQKVGLTGLLKFTCSAKVKAYIFVLFLWTEEGSNRITNISCKDT